MPTSDNTDVRGRQPEPQMAILVVSCDNYSDVWPPFFELYLRFWPDCPFNTYLVSNMKEFSAHGVKTLPVGEDISWSDNLKNALTLIREQYVLVWIDDLFLLQQVDTSLVQEVVNEFIAKDGNYLRLNPTVRADLPFNRYFGVVSAGTIYRTSTVMSLWKKTVLSDLLVAGESAWDFEVMGTVRSDKLNGFYATWQNMFNVLNGVIKGKWRNSAYRKIRTLCTDFNANERDVMSFTEELVLKVMIVRSKLLNLVPPRYRRHLKACVLGKKHTYQLYADGDLKKAP